MRDNTCTDRSVCLQCEWFVLTVLQQSGEARAQTMVSQQDLLGNSALHVAVDNKATKVNPKNQL